MKGFIKWMRAQPVYADLAADSAGCRTLKRLIAEMMAAPAIPEAWECLFAALAAYPGADRLPELPPELFTCGAPDGFLRSALWHWVEYGEFERYARPREFDKLCAYVRAWWLVDEDEARDVIASSIASRYEVCVLYSLRGDT